MKPVTHLTQPVPPPTSYWVGATREELAQAVAARRPYMDGASPKDFDPTWIEPATKKGRQ